MTGRTDKVGQGRSRDRHHENDIYESVTESDHITDDPAWNERTIFWEPPSLAKREIPIAVPLPTDWVNELNYPKPVTAVPVESRYVTVSNVDDFAQSIRDTKEWSFMQYHPALLEVGDAHPQMLKRYQSALNSWNSQHQVHNKKAPNSKRYKGKNDSNRLHSKPYEGNGYQNKPRGNARHHDQPFYEKPHADWDEPPQRIGFLPDVSGHYGGAESLGLHGTQYAAERLAIERTRNDDREFGYEYHGSERGYRYKPDLHGKRRWAEMQGEPNQFQTQNPGTQSRYEDHERSSKRSKYASPEPGEIAEDSDGVYDPPIGSLVPSQRESFSDTHQYLNTSRDNYAQRASTKLHEVVENNEDNYSTGRVATPSISADDASAPETGELVENDMQSPQRNESHTTRNINDHARWYADTRKSPRPDKKSERQNSEEPIFQNADGLSARKRKVADWDDDDEPPTPPRQPSPHSRPSSRRSSKSRWGGSRRRSGHNSRRSSFGDAHVDSPLTPTELALLGLDRHSSSGSDSGRESPKRQLDDVTPKLKSRRAKVHEVYRLVGSQSFLRNGLLTYLVVAGDPFSPSHLASLFDTLRIRHQIPSHLFL